MKTLTTLIALTMVLGCTWEPVTDAARLKLKESTIRMYDAYMEELKRTEQSLLENLEKAAPESAARKMNEKLLRRVREDIEKVEIEKQEYLAEWAK